MVAAVGLEISLELLKHGKLVDYTPYQTLLIALLIGGPIIYVLIAQRLDANVLKDRAEAAQATAEAAQKRLGETQARLGFLAQNSSDIFISLGVDGRITYISPNVRRYGYDHDALQGTPVLDLAHPDDREMLARAMAGLFRDGDGRAEEPRFLRFRTASGEWRWAEANPTLARDADGRAVEVTAVLHDFTERKAALDAIVASEARFRMIADHATDIIVQFDARQLIRYASPACRQLAYEPEALVGRPLTDFIHPDDLTGLRGAQATRLASVRGAPPVLLECRIRKGDGGVSWVEGSTATIWGEGGEVQGAVTVLRLIDDRVAAARDLAASEAQFRLLAENASDVISRCDARGVLTYISPSAERILGYRPAELIGTKAYKLLNPDEGAFVTEWLGGAIAAGATGPLPPMEYRCVTKSGELIWIEASPSVVRDPATGKVVELQDCMRDISVRKAMEEELARKHAEAEAAAVAKADFLANISHELKTPLTGIIGFTTLLESVPALPSQAQTFVQRISSASRALLSLVSDVLDFSRMDAGQVVLDPQPVDAEALLREAIDVVGAQAAAKGLVVRLEVEGRLPPHVRVDGPRLRQVVLNLLSNGVKFTERGEVVVTAGHSREGGGVLSIRVRDTGAGIPAGRAEHLFERFTQADSSVSRKHGGTGLGLSICKALVELMGGGIAVESVEGQGSAFSFDVSAPDVRVEQISAAPRILRRGDAGDGAPRVLIADDVQLNRELIKTILSSLDLELLEVGDGVEAVSLCRTTAFDVILMDLQMPRMGGLEATRKLREACPMNRDTPIVAVSANSAPADVNACLAAGMNDHIGKPISTTELLSKVTHWAQRTASAA